MANTTTINEQTRTPIDGTELIRLATPGANWKTTISSLVSAFPGGLIPATSSMTFHVATTGSDTTGDGSVGNPYQTPEKAISVACSYNWGNGTFFPTIQLADGIYTPQNTFSFILYPLAPFGNIIGSFNGNLTTPTNVVLKASNGLVASGIGSLWNIGGITCDSTAQAYGAQDSATLFVGANGPCAMKDTSLAGGCTVIDGDSGGTCQISFGSTFTIYNDIFCMFAAQNYGTAESGGTINLATTVNGATGSSVGWFEVFDYGNVNQFFGGYTGSSANNYPKYQANSYGNINHNSFPTGTGQTFGTQQTTASINGFLPLTTSSQYGIVKVDGTTIVASASGVISTTGSSGATGANPTATASTTAVNGTATTFMRSDAAPAVQLGTTSKVGLVQPDGTTITVTASGIISSVSSGAVGANPTATASDTVVNGSATTFMRSDASPPVQKATATSFGIVKVDGSTITASSGIISAVATGAATTPVPYQSGSFYLPLGTNGVMTSGLNPNTSTIYSTFGYVGSPVTINQLVARIATGVTSATFQMAVYSVGNTGTLTLVDSTTTVSAATATAVTATLNNTTDTLQPGVLYAFCTNASGSVGISFYGYNQNSANALVGSTSATAVISPANSALVIGKKIAQTFGTWPGTITLSSMLDTGGGSNAPAVGFKVN